MSGPAFSASVATLPERDHRLVINLLGPPGAGKGTQGALLSDLLSIPHVSVGDLFRSELRDRLSPLGTLLRHHFQISQLDPPDEIAAGLIAQRLLRPDCHAGFVIEGFPRSEFEIELLLGMILRPTDRYVPILLRVGPELALSRARERHLCGSCGAQLYSARRQQRCPQCHGEATTQRAEDRDQAYSLRRLEQFESTFPALRPRLSARARLTEIDVRTSDDPSSVCKRIKDAIETAVDAVQNS